MSEDYNEIIIERMRVAPDACNVAPHDAMLGISLLDKYLRRIIQQSLYGDLTAPLSLIVFNIAKTIKP